MVIVHENWERVLPACHSDGRRSAGHLRARCPRSRKTAAFFSLPLLITALLAQEDPAARIGKVYVKSEPAGAAIFVGVKDEKGLVAQKDTGKKTNILLELPEGKQTLTLKLAGYEDAAVNVTVNPAAISKLETITLKKPARSVDVLFVEDGWALFVDDKPILDVAGQPAVPPCTVKLALGKHELLLAKEGFKNVTWPLEVMDKTANVEVKGKAEKTEQSNAVGSFDRETKGTEINLLPLLNPAKEAVSGKWIWKEQGLASEGVGWARLQIPYQPPEEYDLCASFTRTNGSDGVNLILASPGHQFMWWMGDWGNSLFGFQLINGKIIKENPTAVNMSLKTGQRYSCVVKVRKDGVAASLDGRTIVEYKTDFGGFSLGPEWSLRDNRILGVGTASPAVFHSLSITEISGPGKSLQLPPAPQQPEAPAPPEKRRLKTLGD